MKRKGKSVDTPRRRFLHEQIALIQEGKADELIENHSVLTSVTSPLGLSLASQNETTFHLENGHHFC